MADRAGLDPDGARRAIDAVLETLAERIAGGEVDDLVTLLPVELHPALERGKAATGGQATRMSLEQFLGRSSARPVTAAMITLCRSRRRHRHAESAPAVGAPPRP